MRTTSLVALNSQPASNNSSTAVRNHYILGLLLLLLLFQCQKTSFLTKFRVTVEEIPLERGRQNELPLKSHYFAAIYPSNVKTVAVKHRLAAYYNYYYYYYYYYY